MGCLNNFKEFHIIEGVTCSGKTTVSKQIQSVYGTQCLMEHPPLDKGQAPLTEMDYYAHQERVFNAFLAEYRNAPDGVWYVDYSPFGCLPFTKALVDVGLTGCADLIPMMAKELNALCKYAHCYLHRYLPIDIHECLHRLENRARRGDDTWNQELLGRLIVRYDEFFQNDLVLKRDDRIKCLRDGCEIV